MSHIQALLLESRPTLVIVVGGSLGKLLLVVLLERGASWLGVVLVMAL